MFSFVAKHLPLLRVWVYQLNAPVARALFSYRDPDCPYTCRPPWVTNPRYDRFEWTLLDAQFSGNLLPQRVPLCACKN